MKTPQELNELADRFEKEVKWTGFSNYQGHYQMSAEIRDSVAHELRHMAQLRADLHEAAELLRELSGRPLPVSAKWCERRDSFLAKLNRT